MTAPNGTQPNGTAIADDDFGDDLPAVQSVPKRYGPGGGLMAETLANVTTRLQVPRPLAKLFDASRDFFDRGGPRSYRARDTMIEAAGEFLKALRVSVAVDPNNIEGAIAALEAERARHTPEFLGATFDQAMELELDTIAARDREEPAPAGRWVKPLNEILGVEEPSEDDSKDWLVRDVVPLGEVSLLAGPPKTGKTWTALDLAIAVALGLDWLDGRAINTVREPRRVLGVFLEDAERRLARRIWELTRGRGITPNDPTLRAHLAVSRSPLRMPHAMDVPAFTAELKAWKPSLVVIDNVTRILQGDPNATRDAAAFTSSCAQLCLDTGAAVLLLHHTRKSTGGAAPREVDPFDMVRGSGDLVAAARHVMVMRPIDAAEGEAPRAIAELLARGNLDVRVPTRTLELVREARTDGRMTARVLDRGDASTIRAEAANAAKAGRDAMKRARVADEFERRRTFALEMVHAKGIVTAAEVCARFGLESKRTVAPVFEALVASGALTFDKHRHGYVVRDDDGRGAQ